MTRPPPRSSLSPCTTLFRPRLSTSQLCLSLKHHHRLLRRNLTRVDPRNFHQILSRLKSPILIPLIDNRPPLIHREPQRRSIHQWERRSPFVVCQLPSFA